MIRFLDLNPTVEATSEDPATPPFAGPIHDRSKLTGDWLGWRSCLQECGMSFDLRTAQYYQGVTTGGQEQEFQYGGRNDYFLNLDGEKLGLWKQVIDRVIPTENVRAALAAVESGNVDAGIVYRTDAAISNKVKIAYEVPRAEGPKISYPFAVLKSSSDPAAAQRFLDYLASPAGRAVFTRYGFLTPEP